MPNTKRQTGFTLIEMAVVLIIMGIISAVLVPTMMEGFKNEKRAAARAGLQAFRDRITGYAVAGGEQGFLPASTTEVGASKDVWGMAFLYYPDSALTTAGVICDDGTSTTGTSITDSGDSGNSAQNVAFIVASTGHDKTADVALQAATNVTNKGDDLVDYITLFELKSLMCKSDASAGDSAEEEEEETGGGGTSSADEYVIYSAGGDLSVPNGGDVEGDIAADGDVTLQNNVDVNGNVSSTSDVTLSNNADVDGDIYASGDVILHNNADVTGDIHAVGDVHIYSSNVDVGGNIYSNGTVYLDTSAHITGSIHALGGVVVGWNSQVDGDIISGGDVTLAGQAEVGGDVHSGGNVTSGWHADIYGDVYAAGTISPDNSNDIHGTEYPGSSVPPRLTPTEPIAFVPPTDPVETTFTAGGTDQTLGWDNDRVLAPGTYGSLTTGGRNNLYLSAGNYYFDDITMAWDINIYLDLSSGDINIFSVGDVTIDGNLDMRVSSDGSNYTDIDDMNEGDAITAKAANVYTETHGNWSFATQCDWFGTIYTSGNLAFGDQNDLIGSYYTGGVSTMNNQIDMIYVASDYAAAHW